MQRRAAAAPIARVRGATVQRRGAQGAQRPRRVPAPRLNGAPDAAAPCPDVPSGFFWDDPSKAVAPPVRERAGSGEGRRKSRLSCAQPHRGPAQCLPNRIKRFRSTIVVRVCPHLGPGATPSTVENTRGRATDLRPAPAFSTSMAAAGPCRVAGAPGHALPAARGTVFRLRPISRLISHPERLWEAIGTAYKPKSGVQSSSRAASPPGRHMAGGSPHDAAWAAPAAQRTQRDLQPATHRHARRQRRAARAAASQPRRTAHCHAPCTPRAERHLALLAPRRLPCL